MAWLPGVGLAATPMYGPYCKAIHGCSLANEWFTGQPVWNQCGSSSDSGYDWFAQGLHHYRFLTDANETVVHVETDGVLGMGALYCNQSLPSGQFNIVAWEGDLKYDTQAPTVSISLPQNNTNTAAANVSVTGSVSDSGSGIQSVTVNGHAASVQGGAYSVTLPLTIGLNAVTAVATDNAGHQTTSAQVTVFRYEDQKSASGSSNSSTGSGKSQNAVSNNSTQPSSTASPSPSGSPSKAASAAAAAAAPIKTLVKGVSTPAGTGLATVLGVIILLLVLDKFRIIEIKLFRHLYQRRLARVDKSDTGREK